MAGNRYLTLGSRARSHALGQLVVIVVNLEDLDRLAESSAHVVALARLIIRFLLFLVGFVDGVGGLVHVEAEIDRLAALD